MSLIQQEAPEFEAEAVYPEGTIHFLKLTEYRGKYVVLFFYPLDFTFVCPTELVAVSERIAAFHERGLSFELSVSACFLSFIPVFSQVQLREPKYTYKL